MRWKNIACDANTFFITGTITEWRPLLSLDPVRKILLDDLEYYRSKFESRILGYVIMPEHYHLLLEHGLHRICHAGYTTSTDIRLS